ncbi:hypothetical protein JW977_00660 [Candidatus Falkowbacteria bacterium]|nr:hypothetical protein [Candidatus Falkowbacteria bacterium]
MTKEKMVGDVPGNVLGMLADLAHKLQHRKITPEELGLFLQRKNPYDPRLVWKRFYREVFGMVDDFSDIILPRKQKGFERLIIVRVNMMPDRLYSKCVERFASFKTIDDLAAVKSTRETDKTYAIWVSDNEEADEENRDLSANECEGHNIIGITLEERLLLELFYYWQTDKHLDNNNITLCSGSRYSDGSVPLVRCLDGQVCIGRSDPANASDFIRTRSVIV